MNKQNTSEKISSSDGADPRIRMIDLPHKIMAAESALRNNSLQEAKKIYREILELYYCLRHEEQLKVYKEINSLHKKVYETKNLDKKRLMSYGLPIILSILLISLFFMAKPEVTGHATLKQVKTQEEKLNLVINESGVYNWSIDEITKDGINVESIKASGRVSGNGTLKVYIEKDGKRYLIYEKKADAAQG